MKKKVSGEYSEASRVYLPFKVGSGRLSGHEAFSVWCSGCRFATSGCPGGFISGSQIIFIQQFFPAGGH